MEYFKEKSKKEIWERYIEIHKDSKDPGIRKTVRHYRKLIKNMKYTLYIDADSIIFHTVYSPSHKPDFGDVEVQQGSFTGAPVRASGLIPYKKHFMDIVNDIVTTCELESAIGKFPGFDGYKLIFTPQNNFIRHISRL